MRILHINAIYGSRSTGRTVKERHDYLIQHGIQSYVAFSEGQPIDNSFIIGTFFEKKIHGLLSRISGLQGFYSKKGTKSLLNFMDEINPDIVHLGNLHSNYINLPMLFDYLAKNNIATVVTLHDCWFYTGGHTHYLKDKYYSWRDGFKLHKKNNKQMGNKSWFFDKSKKIFDDQISWFSKIEKKAFVGVSEWISNEAKLSKVTSNSSVLTIYNWVDMEKFKPTNNMGLIEKLNLEDKFIILGVASVWNEDKGIKKFFELSRILQSDEQIILVGSLDPKIEIPENIINLKETHDLNLLVNIYSIADVFINFSEEESFGKVSAEALSCGTPIITNKYTANPELVGDGCGYIINEVNEISSIIQNIKLNGSEYYEQNCVNFVSDKFSFNKNMKKYLDLYQSLIR